MKTFYKALIILCFSISFMTGSHALEYFCPVSKKQDFDNSYSLEQLSNSMFSVKVNHRDNLATISRCSYVSSQGKVTCDDYQVDYIHKDTNVGHVKYYYFNGQFDLQVFSNLDFIENNGRGSIGFGSCSIVN